MNRTEATKAARKLISLFPPITVTDPKVFIAGLVELFESYAEKVVEEATSIKYGLPAKHTFVPSIAETKQFCDEARDKLSKPISQTRKLAPPPKDDEEFCKLYNIPCAPNGWTRDKVRKLYERSGETYLRQFVSEALEGYVRKGAH